MMKQTIFLGCLVGMLLGVVNAEWTPFTPEETVFTFTRCMEDNFGNDYALLKKWMSWELPDGDVKTPCYAKCVLKRLELYDEKSNTFKANHILEQHEKYKSYTSQDDSGAQAFQSAVQGLSASGSDCKAVFQAYKPVHDQYKDVAKKIYLGDASITDPIYEADSSLKKKGEPMFRYCEKRNFPEKSDELCNLRKTGLTDNNNHLDCLFRGLRYLDRDGNIDPEEVKRDLHLINVNDKDEVVDKALSGCNVKEGTKARDYNDCLWKNDELKDVLMPSFDYREIRSKSYPYFLTGPKTYDVGKVKAEVRELDQAAGCP